jgi:putative transposase
MIEAFLSRMQVELLDTRRWRRRVELANAIFEYIEVFRNQRRRHSALECGHRSNFELITNETTGAG